MIDGQFTLLEAMSVLQQYKAYGDCSIVNTKFPLKTEYLAFAVPQNSPYREAFNHHLMWMIESGKMNRIVNQYAKPLPSCDGRRGRPLGLESVATALLIVASGLLASLCFLILEMAYNWCDRIRK